MKKIIALALCLMMVFALCGVASADFAPNGPVSMIVAYKAGSGTDNTARVLAKYAEKYVGQTIVIENVEGGSGSIGWSQLADADPDGQTIGFINLPNFSSSIVNEMGTYTVESFAPIANHVTETSIVIVRADDDRFPDLEALVAYGKENEGTKNELLASTNGPQASNHIGAQAFANSAGFMYTDIPQGGTADQLLSLRGAEADFSVVKLADIAGQEAEYRILGVFAEERLPELPDAFVCGNDKTAARLRQTLARLGRKVPEEIMLAGFDDVRCAVTMLPPLTTVHQPCEDIALVAYRALRERMRDPSLPPRRILVPAPLVVRESTHRTR